MEKDKDNKVDINKEIYEKAVVTQYNSNIYKNLQKDGRVDKFIMAIKLCSFQNFSKKATCNYLSKLFPTYFKGGKLHENTFNKLLERYPDIRNAWQQKRELDLFVAYAKSLELVEKTEELRDAIKFIETFDTNGIFISKDESKLEKGMEELVVNYTNSRLQKEGGE
jgi:hypothetical protein